MYAGQMTSRANLEGESVAIAVKGATLASIALAEVVAAQPFSFRSPHYAGNRAGG
jgi:hypothetical protein